MKPYTQTCFVARDFERAIPQWTAIGAGPFFVPDLSALPPDRNYRGTITRDETIVARGFLGTTQIEIATPLNDEPSIFREVLAARGEGLHHVMPSIQPTSAKQFDALSAKYEDMGLTVAYSMVGPWLGLVAYYDGFDKLGYFIELTERTEHVHAGALEMYKAHLGWNGSDPSLMASRDDRTGRQPGDVPSWGLPPRPPLLPQDTSHNHPIQRIPRRRFMDTPTLVPVATGLGFIEGPLEMPDGRIMFTDIGAGSLMVYDPRKGSVEQFASTGGGTNAVARGPDGAYYVCNNGGLGIVKSPEGYNLPVAGTHGNQPIPAGIQRVSADGTVSSLYTSCNGVPLVSPNDLVFDSFGGFYFTDTGEPGDRTTDLGGLYYAKADGSHIVELIHESAPHTPLSQPNGCGLSPDGSRLYVVETGNARLWYWDIEAPGRLKEDKNSFISNRAKLLYSAPDYILFDSLAVDAQGNICVATPVGGCITIITPDGRLDSSLPLPVYDPFPTNICFAAEDMQDAYLTAAGTGILYRFRWPRGGLRLNYAQ